MKAKLKVSWDFNRANIEKGTEVTIIKGMEADAADVLNAPYGMCYLCELNGCMTYVPANYLIVTNWDNTDWQQVRIQASIAAMQGFCTNSSVDLEIDKLAKLSVEQADALIDELKKTM